MGLAFFPHNALLRVAAYAVVQAGPDGTIGANQTPYRAELFALTVAFAAYSKPWAFTDCLGVAKRANRLIQAKRLGQELPMPHTNLDLWTLFVQQLDGVELEDCMVTWIPSHKDRRQCEGVARAHPCFNHWADQAAKAALQSQRTALYLSHVQAWEKRQPLVLALARYHSAVAQMFVQASPDDPPSVPVCIANVTHPGRPEFCSFPEVLPPSRHAHFLSDLARWLSAKPWTPSAHIPGLGTLTDMSWLELFWGFLWDTRGYPPFLFQGEWVCVSDDLVHFFVLPSTWTLLRTFVRFVGILLKAGVSRPWGHTLSQVNSVTILGSRFVCAGFPGRIALGVDVLRSLSDVLATCSKVTALRLPFV
eukprot:Skav231476  [mRNA]  locus=scaffold1100:567379:568467:+ [translate_table: standard]